MKKIECVIVDDEPLAVRILTKFIEKHPKLDLKQSFTRSNSALNFIQTYSADLLFLDIHMPGLTGLEFLNNLSDKIPCILTTAYRDYAVEGFELDVVDYLMKPIRYERFCKAVDRVTESQSNNYQIQSDTVGETILIKMNRKIYRIPVDQILYLESNRNTVLIKTINEDYKCVNTLKNMIEELPSHFLQVHRSFVVNKKYVTTFTKQEVGLGVISLPVGESYASSLSEL